MRAWKRIDIRASALLEEHVRQASEEAIAWTKEQEFNKALREHASLPNTAPPVPIYLELADDGFNGVTSSHFELDGG